MSYQHAHPHAVAEFRNATHWPKHLLVRYSWDTHNDVDLDRGLYVLFGAGGPWGWAPGAGGSVSWGIMSMRIGAGGQGVGRRAACCLDWELRVLGCRWSGVRSGAWGGVGCGALGRHGIAGAVSNAAAEPLEHTTTCPPQSLHPGAPLLCCAALLVFAVLAINAVRGAGPKLTQFLAEVTGEAADGGASTSWVKSGGAKAE